MRFKYPDRASSKARDPRAPTHGDRIVERGVHSRKGGDGSDDTAGGGAGDKAKPTFEQGDGSADSTSGLAAGTGPLASRRHVEERLAFLNGKARECEEEVGLLFILSFLRHMGRARSYPSIIISPSKQTRRRKRNSSSPRP